MVQFFLQELFHWLKLYLRTTEILQLNIAISSNYVNMPTYCCSIIFRFFLHGYQYHQCDTLCCRYFRALANGETPPVKERLEMPVATQKTDTGLTPGLLRVLNKQVRNPQKIFVRLRVDKTCILDCLGSKSKLIFC